MKQPLEGVRVIDVSRLEIGAMATQLLADLGADVIKVEPPGGEEIRRYLPRLGADNVFTLATYRNKRSVEADLKTDAGRQLVHDLVRDADVFVEVSRRGVMERLGLDHPTLAAINPRLVYCSLLAFGNDGPYAMQNSHSPDIDYYAGVAQVVDDGEGGLRMTDLRNISAHAGAASAAMGILAAIIGARVHRQGSYVEASMWDAAVTWDAIRATMALNDTWFPGGDDLGSRATPKHGAYATSDGKSIVISAVEPRYWRNFCDAIGRPELGENIEEQTDSATDFGGAFEGLYESVAQTIAERTAEEWEEIFAVADVPFALVKSRLEALTSEHAQARDIVRTIEDRNGEQLRTVGRSFLLDGDRGSVRRVIPAPGEHTAEVLAELGYSVEQVDALRPE